MEKGFLESEFFLPAKPFLFVVGVITLLLVPFVKGGSSPKFHEFTLNDLMAFFGNVDPTLAIPISGQHGAEFLELIARYCLGEHSVKSVFPDTFDDDVEFVGGKVFSAEGVPNQSAAVNPESVVGTRLPFILKDVPVFVDDELGIRILCRFQLDEAVEKLDVVFAVTELFLKVTDKEFLAFVVVFTNVLFPKFTDIGVTDPTVYPFFLVVIVKVIHLTGVAESILCEGNVIWFVKFVFFHCCFVYELLSHTKLELYFFITQ